MRSSSVRRPALTAAAVLATFTLAPGCGRSSPPGGTSGSRGSYAQSFEVTASRPTGGTIASAVNGVPDGQIVCGTGGTRCGPAGYPWSATVSFVATPDPGWKFVTWAADCTGRGPCAVDTSRYGADKWIAAGFEPESWFPGRAFIVAVSRPQNGTISSPDGKILCGTSTARCGPVVYAWTDTVTLTAAADAGFAFQGWTDSCEASGTATTCALTSAAPADKTVGATFGAMGTDGGVVENPAVPGVVVTVPPGALDTPTPISVSVATSPEPPPPGVEVLSPVYRFEPEGIVFADVVKVKLPIPAGVTGPVGVYWRKHLAPGYDYVGGTVTAAGDAIEVASPHFSDAFVGPASDTRTIQGTRFLSYLGAGGKIQNVPDSANLLDEVAALVPVPGGGYIAYPGTAGIVNGTPDGTFAIENVPAGTAFVQVGLRYVETSADALSLTRILYGRPDMTAIPWMYPPGPTPAPVYLGLTNLAPWQSGDELHLFSPDADTLAWDTSPPGITIGGTTVTGVRDLSTISRFVPMHEIEGTLRGDVTFVSQLSRGTSPGGFPYLGLSRFMMRSTFDLTPMTSPAQPSSLVGAMSQPALADRTISLAWNLPAFDAALASAVPSQTPGTPTFYVYGEPNALQYGVTPRADKRTFLKMQLPAGSPPLNTGDMPFKGTAKEDLWGLYWAATMGRCCVMLTPPAAPGQPTRTIGYQTTIQTLGALGRQDTNPAVAVALEAPDVAPVSGITINGDPLDSPRLGVGLVPTIAWTAPVTGATVYTVIVQHLVPTATTMATTVAVVDTTRTSFEMPPGVLQLGEPYAISIRASSRGVDVNRPFRMDLPMSSATTESQWFVP